MPATRRHKLLLGLSAVLSVCATGSGCQTRSMNTQPATIAAHNSTGGLNPAWTWLRYGGSADVTVRSDESAPTHISQPVVASRPMSQPPLEGGNAVKSERKGGLNPTWAKLRFWGNSSNSNASASFTAETREAPLAPMSTESSTIVVVKPRQTKVVAESPAGEAAVIVSSRKNVVATGVAPAEPVIIEGKGSALPLAIASTRPAATVPVVPAEDEPRLEPVPKDGAEKPATSDANTYSIITDGEAGSEQSYRVPLAANETVADALAQFENLKITAGRKRVWIMRSSGQPGQATMLPVDVGAIRANRALAGNYRLQAGDRIYVKSVDGKELPIQQTRGVQRRKGLFGGK